MDYKDPELVHSRSFEMNWQQTYRGQVFMLCGGKVRSYMIIPSLWGCMFWFLPAGRFLWNFEAFSIYTDWVLESLKHSCFGTAFSFLTIHSVWGAFKWCPNPQFGWIQTEVLTFGKRRLYWSTTAWQTFESTMLGGFKSLPWDIVLDGCLWAGQSQTPHFHAGGPDNTP
jgi:hypothetical protein